MFSVQLQAYIPGGAALGELPFPISWEASVARNDVGGLTLDYSTLSAGGQHIARPMDDGLEVALQVWNGAAWVEPRGCRFIRLKQNEVDKADGSQVFRVTFVSWGWQLRKATLLGGPFGSDLRRVFTAPTAGGLLNTLLNENNTRGGIATQMTIIGGGANDAGGTPWVALPDQPFDYGKDYLSITRGLQEGGALDWATQARGLYAYIADSASLSPDLSSTIRLTLGRDIIEAPAEETIEDLVGSLGVSADAGGNVIVDEPAAPSPHGIWEGHLAIGQATDVSAAISMAEAELERVARARQQFTHALVLRDDSKIPLIDYWPGCWITAPTNSLAESVRLQQITLTYGKDGYGANVVLNDRFTEYDIRRARLLGNLAGGQVGSGGAPPPIFVDPEASRVPSVPGSFATTTSLSFIGPTPRGVITSSWSAVTTATDSGLLDISGYEFQWRVGAGAWQTIFTPELSAMVSDLTPGDSIQTRVRAIGVHTTNPSAWSSIDTDVVPGDVTAPPVPTTPTLVSALKIVSVTWDGLLGAAIPADFAYVEVAVGTEALPATVRGTLTEAGTLQVTAQTLGVAIGATVRARLRSVDSTGNTSAWSTVSTGVAVAGVAGPDLAANSVTANAMAAGALDAFLVTGATIRTSATNPRVEMNATGLRAYNAGGVETVSILGSSSTITAATIRTSATNPRVEMNATGLRAYNVSGVETISILGSTSTITGATIRTAASGDRLEMTTAGLKAWTAGVAVAEFLPGGLYLNAGGELVVEYADSNPALLVGDLGSNRFGIEMYRATDGADVFTLATNELTDAVTLTMDGLTTWTVAATTSSILSTASFQVQGGGANGANLSVLSVSATRGRLSAHSADNVNDNHIEADPTAVRLETLVNGVSDTRVTLSGDISFLTGGIRRLLVTSGGSVALDNLITATSPSATLDLGALSGSFYPLRRITSSLRYKQDVEDHLVNTESFLSIRPRSWRAKQDVQEDPSTTVRHVGFIAEEVHDAGFPEFVQYDLDGLPDGLNYDRMIIGSQAILIDHEARIADLATRLATLEAA